MESRRDEVRAAYDAIAEDYAATFPSTEPELPVDLAMLDHFVGRVVAGGGAHVLDAGCGTGRIARYLVDRGLSVVGVDLSPGMLAMARRDHPDLELHEGSLTELPLADVSVDGVVFWYSLIHLTGDELPVALAEAVRVLRPGGHVLLAFQKGEGTYDVGAGLRERGHDVSLVRWHRGPKQVLDALADAGFVKEARLVREPVGRERHGQAFVLARLG
ncbi:class I SAM-dependent methyltransferase [Phycicoccus sp. DTK01]|uniref:class I SAM-dependent DNA methyltransferase n=1 Tax=Phycicoccus sp. DTK01 TaxID=2785745 RepID=UPI001AA9E905|nr:methyltransferase domain-containing protein [Phycicoccus sp. DTK01]GIL34280.1 methyltransferase [Phycicoccus sp. DTK01]